MVLTLNPNPNPNPKPTITLTDAVIMCVHCSSSLLFYTTADDIVSFLGKFLTFKMDNIKMSVGL